MISLNECGIQTDCVDYLLKTNFSKTSISNQLNSWTLQLTKGINNITLNESLTYPKGSIFLLETNDIQPVVLQEGLASKIDAMILTINENNEVIYSLENKTNLENMDKFRFCVKILSQRYYYNAALNSTKIIFQQPGLFQIEALANDLPLIMSKYSFPYKVLVNMPTTTTTSTTSTTTTVTTTTTTKTITSIALSPVNTFTNTGLASTTNNTTNSITATEKETTAVASISTQYTTLNYFLSTVLNISIESTTTTVSILNQTGDQELNQELSILQKFLNLQNSNAFPAELIEDFSALLSNKKYDLNGCLVNCSNKGKKK